MTLLLSILAGLALLGQDASARPDPATTLSDIEVTAPATEAVVRVSCALQADGRLRDCRILSERPLGLGLGEAALRSAERSRVNLDVVRGSPEGARVEYNIRFRPENMPRP